MFHVKHSPLASEIFSLMRESCLKHGLRGSEAQISRLSSFIEWLAPKAHQLGLTRYRTPLLLAEHLVVPALFLLKPPALDYIGTPLLDFGAGSGGIGLSMAFFYPEWQIYLADRRQRVIQFMELAIKRWHLDNCTALHVDLAAPPDEFRGHIQTGLIRALCPPLEALKLARLWLAPQGIVALWHKPEKFSIPNGFMLAEAVPTNLPSLQLSIFRFAGI